MATKKPRSPDHEGGKDGGGDGHEPELAGTSIWQKHGGPTGCGSWATVGKGTETEVVEDARIVTRYRWCNACQKRYTHVTVFKRFMGSWTESGSAFK